ncbi:MAG: TadE/TadG family type IV pilus assembly protein [Holosporales bacterium]
MLKIEDIYSFFLKDTNGSFMILAALTMSTLMGFVGLAVDVGRTTDIKENVQAAVDASSGACAATWLTTKDASKAEDAGRRFFAANLNPNYSGGLLGTQNGLQLRFNQGTESCDITVQGEVPTTFSKVFGAKTLSLTNVSSSKIKGSSRLTKLVLILDKSGSNNLVGATCNPEKFEQVKMAAQNTVDRFFTFRQSGGNSFLGTVFYNSAVTSSALESDASGSTASVSGAVAEVCTWTKPASCTRAFEQQIYGNSGLARPGNNDFWLNCLNNSLGAIIKADDLLKEKVSGQDNALEVLEIGVLVMSNVPTHDADGKISLNNAGGVSNEQQLKDDMVRACDDFKRAGVTRTTNKTKIFRLLYTVGYNSNAANPKFNFMRQCASYPEMYYEADPAKGAWDLPNILEKISTEIRLIMDGAQVTQ